MRQAALLLLFPTLLAQGSITGGGSTGTPGRSGSTDTRQMASPQPTKPEDLCTVEGQVINAVTGEPVRRASILLMRAEPVPGETGPPTTYSTQSSPGGHFAMKDIEPGKFRLTVNRNGHVTSPPAFNYLASGPGSPASSSPGRPGRQVH
jgi:hypothetical protein